MKENGRVNALLVELLIVLLFFMLASTTLMEIFGAAKLNSSRAGASNAALMQAQNVAEQLYASQDVEQALEALGFAKEGEDWRLNGGEYELIASYLYTQDGAGALRQVELTAMYHGEELFTLPATRYVSGEVQP
ncbi:MAG: hypothetical protein IJX84_08115 [Clostridia bacterium]|nr:hypothetical protein [Clostridia bacterium]